MNPSNPPSATSGPQTHGADTEIWRVLATLAHGQLIVTIRPASPDDPPLHDWAEFRNRNDIRSGTTFNITRHNALREMHDFMRYLFPLGGEVVVTELEQIGGAKRAVT
ncbi:hypothetical protein FDENT_5709 [Fusarium denticulatum]|uniref:Uncharacterized protein n=1 Tax=Fusarium denticulatum TaxID=48507 RepID=A0A8H5X8Q2_9HYPO|nr:hypothetical protein FDENT_5709 [Fusarium denticulatum]